ncbi:MULTISPECIES: hypothetical protein [Acidithrix]|uniref:hypothetical protein n=1 Tax=Acidithrix TaxID=1609233 RepID=UPI001269C0CA|nr:MULTISPECIES: hypothetical protein [Acidithrix]
MDDVNREDADALHSEISFRGSWLTLAVGVGVGIKAGSDLGSALMPGFSAASVEPCPCPKAAHRSYRLDPMLRHAWR